MTNSTDCLGGERGCRTASISPFRKEDFFDRPYFVIFVFFVVKYSGLKIQFKLHEIEIRKGAELTLELRLSGGTLFRAVTKIDAGS